MKSLRPLFFSYFAPSKEHGLERSVGSGFRKIKPTVRLRQNRQRRYPVDGSVRADSHGRISRRNPQ